MWWDSPEAPGALGGSFRIKALTEGWEKGVFRMWVEVREESCIVGSGCVMCLCVDIQCSKA